ncbi:MAG: cupin domain-containing protein [Gammaproteobacteria bacterium]
MTKKPFKYQSSLFLFGQSVKREVVDEGVTRQVLGFDDSILMARASFEQGAVGYVHAHPHSQLAYVESGAFDFTIGTETQRLEVGDCAYIPPDVEHGAVCQEAGVLLDVFSPIRDDFLTEN